MKQWNRDGRIFMGTAACLLAFQFPAYAEVLPDAGVISQPQTPVVTPQKPTDITVEQQKQQLSQPTAGPKLLVKKFQVTGQDIYPAATLENLCKDYAGHELTFQELDMAAGRITSYFRSHGYMVATAWLPAQTVKNGVVNIQVVLGRYGEIQLHNTSSLQDGVLQSMVSALPKGAVIQKDKLDEVLLSISDTSGIKAKATLKPGRTTGTSDLVLDVTNGPKVSGYAYVDNWGNRYTGHNRLGVTTNINNVSGAGDRATIGGIYSGEGMWDYDLSYQVPLDGRGTRLGVSWSQMRYSLGSEFQNLDATGLSRTLSVSLSKVLHRSRSWNLQGLLAYNVRHLKDNLDNIIPASDSQKSSKSITAGIMGDFRDSLGGGGFNTFSLMGSTGHLSADSADAMDSTAAAGTRGGYQKGNLGFSRLQAVNDRVNLYFTLNAQLASRNLDSSEKMTFGGPSAVRAYGVGSALGDTGCLFTTELRWNLPTPEYQLAVFYDHANFSINKSGEDNNRVLSGAGLGFLWNRPNNFSLRLDYAWPITPADRMEDGHTSGSGHFWLQGVKYF